MMFLYSGEPHCEEEEEEEEEETVEPPEKTEEDTTHRSAVIENIQNNGQEFLTMLVENVLKGSSVESKDFSIETIPESNCAVVTFSYSKGKSWVVFPNRVYSSDVHAKWYGGWDVLGVNHLASNPRFLLHIFCSTQIQKTSLYPAQAMELLRGKTLKSDYLR